ncbi:EpsG family protein [Bifidobacterium sp. 64T4]|nr:EpsG family protein [Bifidobacterium pongonis]
MITAAEKSSGSKSSNKILLIRSVVFLLAVGVIYYHVECVRYVDYDRMSNEMSLSLTKGVSYLFDTYSVNPLSAVPLVLVSRIGAFPLLKSVSACVYYGVLLYVARKLREKCGAFGSILSALFFLCTVDLSYPADAIRFPIASAIFALAYIGYFYFSFSLSKTIILMLISCLFHVSMWPFFIVFLCVLFFRRRLFLVVLSIVLLSYFQIVNSVSSLVASISPELGWKLQLYFEIGGQHYQSLISKEQILYLFFILICCIVLFFVKKRVLNETFGQQDICYILYCCFVFGSVQSNVIFPRYIPFIIFISIPIVAIFFEPYVNKGYKKKNAYIVHFAFVSFALVLVAGLVLRFAFSYVPFYIA